VLNKIFSPFLLIFSVIMFGYIFFQSEIILNSEKRNYYLLYYIISITLIIISIISFFLDKKIRTYLIIILISIFSTLYIFEIILSYDNYFFNKEIKLKEKSPKVEKERQEGSLEGRR